MLLFTGDYSLKRPSGAASSEQTTSVEKVEPKKEVDADASSSANSLANGEAESVRLSAFLCIPYLQISRIFQEDESNGLCPEMKSLWKEHSEERLVQ